MAKINIAMDGPVGSGKTTIGRWLAKKLGYNFFDSGLLYRHFALFYQQNSSLHSEEEKEKLLWLWKDWLTQESQEKVVATLEKGCEQLGTAKISDLASRLSSFPKLRKITLDFQRELAEKKGWVVVGRDITSEVLPKAEIKIFLTASLVARTQRRNNQYGSKSSFEAVKLELEARDERDKNRKISPLIKTADSWELDTTYLSLEESGEKILTYFHSQGY